MDLRRGITARDHLSEANTMLVRDRDMNICCATRDNLSDHHQLHSKSEHFIWYVF